MIPQLAEPYRKLESQKAGFLDVLAAATPAQLAFRTKPDAWTMIPVGPHVALAEQRPADAIKKHRGIRSGRRSLRYRVGNAGGWLVLKTGVRVRNPVPEAEPEPDIDLATLLELWEKTRTDLESVLSEVKERGLTYAAFKHPVAGPFNVEESVHFLVAHLEHHRRQIERIRQHPDLPDGL